MVAAQGCAPRRSPARWSWSACWRWAPSRSTDRAAFPDATVWSGYGRGYGFVPLVLPVLGLLWLRHKALDAEDAEDADASAREPAPPPSS